MEMLRAWRYQMRYRTIDVRIWGDNKFRLLSPLQPSGQVLFLYLLTNPSTTSLPGLYRAGAAGMAEELGWSLEDFMQAFDEVSAQGLAIADFVARVVFIPNAIKYNKPQSPNVVLGWASHWDEIPECELKQIAFQRFEGFVNSMTEAFREAFHKAFSKAKGNQEQEKEQNQEVLISSQSKDKPECKPENKCPHDAVIALYHEILPMCPPVRMWHPARRSLLQSRWREDKKRQDIEWWRGYFEHVKQSRFLTGNILNQDGKPPFIADLEWLIRPNNFAKVIEGKYNGGAA